MIGDIDPRQIAVEETARIPEWAIDTGSPAYRAVRDWVMELDPVSAQWLLHAVNSGSMYSKAFTSARQ